jgi:hypothetical protein
MAVTGTWVPSTTALGTHAELETFIHTIRFFVPGAAADPTATPPVEAGADVYYKIRITALDANQNTVSCTYPTPLDPASISGYYKGIFNDTLTTRDRAGNLKTITTLQQNQSVFSAVDRTAKHVISFIADSTRSRTFNYLAEAIDTVLLSPTYNQVVASQNYTIKAEDRNWTPGQTALKELVSYTESN